MPSKKLNKDRMAEYLSAFAIHFYSLSSKNADKSKGTFLFYPFKLILSPFDMFDVPQL